MFHLNKSKVGATLPEILMVLAIIGTISAITFELFQHAKVATSELNIKLLQQIVDVYISTNSKFNFASMDISNLCLPPNYIRGVVTSCPLCGVPYKIDSTGKIFCPHCSSTSLPGQTDKTTN